MDSFFYSIEKLLKWILCNILKFSISEERLKIITEFIKFGVIGLSNTVISYIIYVVALLFLQTTNYIPNLDYLVAQIWGFLLSVLWSFYWNNKFVFKTQSGKRSLFHTLIKTYISYAFTGLFLNSILSVLWVEVMHWSKMIAPIINLLISVPLNFVLNKFWAFKSK